MTALQTPDRTFTPPSGTCAADSQDYKIHSHELGNNVKRQLLHHVGGEAATAPNTSELLPYHSRLYLPNSLCLARPTHTATTPTRLQRQTQSATAAPGVSSRTLSSRMSANCTL